VYTAGLFLIQKERGGMNEGCRGSRYMVDNGRGEASLAKRKSSVGAFSMDASPREDK